MSRIRRKIWGRRVQMLEVFASGVTNVSCDIQLHVTRLSSALLNYIHIRLYSKALPGCTRHHSVLHAFVRPDSAPWKPKFRGSCKAYEASSALLNPTRLYSALPRCTRRHSFLYDFVRPDSAPRKPKFDASCKAYYRKNYVNNSSNYTNVRALCAYTYTTLISNCQVDLGLIQ